MKELPMEATTPTAFRRWAGALTLPLFFLALIVATLTDPLDDQGSNATQLRQAAAHLGSLKLTFFAELLAAGLFLAATMAVVGAVRRRGAGLANAGAVLGVVGGVGLSLIGMAHVDLYALVASGASDAERVLGSRDAAAGAVVPLFLAAPLAVVLLCCAAVRARLAPWPLLVVVGAFVVLGVLPTPLGELPALVAGLVAYTWVALGILGVGRTAGLTVGSTDARTQVPARPSVSSPRPGH
jgi:hypothetical protein